MNFKKFSTLISLYKKKKINRVHFINQWEKVQRAQGLKEVKAKPWPGLLRGYGPLTREI